MGIKQYMFLLTMLPLLIRPCSAISDAVDTSSSSDLGTNQDNNPSIFDSALLTDTSEQTQSAIELQTNLMEVSYYQLRIEFITTSDRARLVLKNPENVLIAHIVNAVGEKVDYNVRTDRIVIRQSPREAQEGQRVSVTVDLALNPAVLNEPLGLSLQSTELGQIKVLIYSVVGGNIQQIFEIDHQGDFELDLKGKIISGSQRKQIPTINPPKMLWAFYYIWYSDSYWNSYKFHDQPLMGHYMSDNPAVFATHIDQAKAAGIDGFIASWWGPQSYTDNNLRLLLDEAARKNFQIAIYFETDGTDQNPRTIYRWLHYALSEYGRHKALARINGKPVIVLWNSNSVPIEDWKRIFDELRKAKLDGIYISMGYDNQKLAVFDGLHEYTVFQFSDLAREIEIAAKSVRYYPLFTAAPAKIWAATAQPGFDDRLVPGRVGRYQNRNDGQFYRDTFDLALKTDPDWIFITSWNEWPEHSYIEPSELYGDQYLKITREFSEKWKGR